MPNLVDCYGWIVPARPTPLPVKRQLSEKNKDVIEELWEKTEAETEKNRFPNQDSFTNVNRQLGKPLHSGTLVLLVKQLNPRLFVEDSINCKGHAGFYYEQGGEKRYTNANFKKGIMPEFSIIKEDTAGQPIGIEYGWREVLLRLVKARLLSLRQVIRVFGETNTVQSKDWRREIQPFRS